MDQQQPIEVQKLSLSQIIEEVDNHFENIKSQINDEFNEFDNIPKKSTVLIFLGEFGKQFDSFYNHFETKQVILDKKYYKLVRIEKQGKISYLLNFPLILMHDDQNDEIAQNLCISKIYAEMALKKMETCYFYLIVDIQQLNGNDDMGKLVNVMKDSIFFFGSYNFNFEKYFFFFLKHHQENKWKYQQFSNSTEEFLSYFQKGEQLKTKTLNQNKILKEIFKSDNYLKVKKVKSEDFINYGKMITYLDKQYDLLKKQFNNNIQQFQKLLLYLQQMPIIKNNKVIIEEVGEYLKELGKGLNDKNNPLSANTSQIGKVYQFINEVNKGQSAQKINERVRSPDMLQFLEDNKMKQLKIEPLISNEVIDKLNKIIQFFEQYHNSPLKNDKISEVQHLKLNLKLWCSYCNETIENTLYDLKYITKRIQEGPEKEIENGIYFIGVTKVGKSTIINTLLDSEQIIQKEFLKKKCYGIKMETKFAISEGGVSETQKISGVYIGKKEELNQIFKKEEQSVFSLEEVLDQNQIKNCKIPQKWFIFDCPGFDDNCNELMRIAHRISLYNYFSKTKNLIAFFVIDISQEQIEYIKNTFDPISYLLKNKDDLELQFEKWTNLILTKGKEGSREQYLDQKNWQIAYKGHLDQNYSFYRKLFDNNNRCIEFPKPSKNKNIEKLNDLTQSIINMSQNQLEQKQGFSPTFQLVLDNKVWTLYQQCIPFLQLKLEHIIKFLHQDLDEYILESDDSIEKKKEQLEKLQKGLLNKNLKNNGISLKNCQEFLQVLSIWVNSKKYPENYDLFLKLQIEDMESLLQISGYLKNTNHIATFQIKIDKLDNQITKILKHIDNQIKKNKIMKAGCYLTGGVLIGFGLCYSTFILATSAYYFLLTKGSLIAVTCASQKVIFGVAITSAGWDNHQLKIAYQAELDKEQQQEQQELIKLKQD